MVSLKVNGATHTVDVDDDTPLLWAIRDNLGLTGTKFGCGIAQCGACTVMLDGMPRRSCVTPIGMIEGSEVTTIEGLAGPDGTLHPMQEAFREHHALQCGFCTPGMVMSAIDLVKRHPEGLSEAEIRHGLEGNLCRCTGYHNIVAAIDAAQQVMHGRKPALAPAAE